MWTIEYIFSQICVIIAVALFIATTFIKNKKVIVILNVFVNTFYALQYLLLNRYTGILINGIGIIRSIWFYFDTKITKKDYISLIVCTILVIGGGIFTYSSWIDIMAIIGSSAFTYGIWQSNIQIYRILAVVNNACFLVFNLFCKSYISVATEVIVIIITTINIIRFYLQTKKSSNSTENTNLQENTDNSLDNLRRNQKK